MKVTRLVCIGACLLGMASGKHLFAQDAVQDCPETVSSSGNVIPPLLIKKVNPQYSHTPKMDFATGSATVEGDVVMDIVIGRTGLVRYIKVTRGLPQLMAPAVHAVSQWQYQPARVNGVAIACKTAITMSFKQTDDPAAAAAMRAADNSAPNVAPPGVIGVKPVLPPPPEGVMRISGRQMATMLDKRVEPVYPPDAAALDARGTVLLLAIVSKTGEIRDVQVISGPDRFRDAAATAVRQWHYKPYLVNDQPVDVQTMITLDFAPPSH